MAGGHRKLSRAAVGVPTNRKMGNEIYIFRRFLGIIKEEVPSSGERNFIVKNKNQVQ